MADVDERYRDMLKLFSGFPTATREDWENFVRTMSFFVALAPFDIIGEINSLAPKVADIIGRVTTVSQQLGDPDALYRTADTWTEQVQTPLTHAANDAAPELLKGLQSWSGNAAEQYKNAATKHVQALGAFKDMTSAANLGLRLLAAANANYIVAIGSAIEGFHGAFVTAISNTVTLIGIPGAFGAVDQAIRDLARAIDTAATAYSHEVDVNTGRIKDVMGTGPFTTGDNWPTVDPAGYGDATVKDRNPSKWTPK